MFTRERERVRDRVRARASFWLMARSARVVVALSPVRMYHPWHRLSLLSYHGDHWRVASELLFYSCHTSYSACIVNKTTGTNEVDPFLVGSQRSSLRRPVLCAPRFLGMWDRSNQSNANWTGGHGWSSCGWLSSGWRPSRVRR